MSIEYKEKVKPNKLKAEAINNASLSELQEQFVFITHAAWLHSDLIPSNADPLQLFYDQFLPSKHPYIVFSNNPIFSGLSGMWNNVVILIDKEDWPIIETQLDAIASIDRKKKIINFPIKQRLPLLDFRSSKVAYVDLIAYGVSTNKYSCHFVPPIAYYLPIVLKKDDPEEEALLIAKRIFKNG